jgi:hypothetical protein
MRTQHPWAYDWSQAQGFSEELHGSLRDAIRRHLA